MWGAVTIRYVHDVESFSFLDLGRSRVWTKLMNVKTHNLILGEVGNSTFEPFFRATAFYLCGNSSAVYGAIILQSIDDFAAASVCKRRQLFRQFISDLVIIDA